MRRIIVLQVLFGVCCATSKAPGAVVITGDDTYAQVFDGTTFNTDIQTNTGGTTAVATLPGYSSVTKTFESPSVMQGSYIQSRAGTETSFSFGSYEVLFSATANDSYSAIGSFSNSDGYTYLEAFLYDLTTSTYPYISGQGSNGGPANFLLGGTGGNDTNTLFGSPSGTLVAGHSYQWYSAAYSYAFSGPDSGALASGSTALVITAAVPEFSSAIVWSLLALTIGGAGWWQRAKTAA